MAIADGPRIAAGYSSETALYGNLVADLTETVPALAWPDNIATYGAMRNDTQIGGILRAYTLPLRSATWMIDPAGCSKPVVQMCADALGLAILGDDESATGPFRRRGVLWDEHLDVALDMLIYGHMPFAIGGEVTGTPLQWHLAELSERMPSTLTKISVRPDGKLKSVTQFGGDSNEIAASNLLWYVHGKRGGNWAGRSILRESYAPWLLKHEMWRVIATSSRRFGTGIPVVTAPTGATDAQIGYAQQLAGAMRVGDQAGIGLPNGFDAHIALMKGTLPDTLGFVRYLDQQIATSVLATVLNLDASPNGSRALGDTLLSILKQSWVAVAREIATPANRLLADMVDWNYGPDENVPRIIIRDLDRPEPTAEAVQMLMNAGAIKYDPNLENAMRGKYQIPAPDQAWLDEQQAATNAANAALQLANQAAADKVNGAPDNGGNPPGEAAPDVPAKAPAAPVKTPATAGSK